ARLDQKDSRAGGVRSAKLRRKGPPRQFGERARQLDARRPAADDGEGEEARTLLRILRRLGAFEGLERPAADGDRVRDGLEGWSVPLPRVVAEIGMGGAGRKHQ